VISEEDREGMDRTAIETVDAAVEYAENSPFPVPESLYDDVYVLGDQVQGWYSIDERSAGVHKGEDERKWR
jgi:TPP-dependent pyruvate/acetoin dehydrogenase alpha subunit